MDRIKELFATRISENSDWANRAKRHIPFLPDGIMKKGDEIVASGKLYKLPYIPYTGELSNRLYFTENENGGATIYICNGFVQELAVFNADCTSFKRTMPNREDYDPYIKNLLDWFAMNR